MRIAYVTETFPPEINGVALTAARMVDYLRERGHAVELLRPRQRGEPPLDTDQEWRTSALPVPMYPDRRFGLASSSRLRRRFERTRPQLVHVATQGPLGRSAILAATALGLPLTTDFRTNFHTYNRYYRLGWLEPALRRYLRSLHNRADRTFVPTRAMREHLNGQGFERLEVIGRGVDPMLFSPRRRSHALRASWGAPDDDQLVMLYVGRLAPEKNVGLALRAFTAVQCVRPRTRMVVVGDGPQRNRLAAEFPAAHFSGVKRGEALAEYYASADLFVSPSNIETFGNVTLEALASGLAVLSFDAGAATEHICHGQNGLVVAANSAGDDETSFIQTACRAALCDTLSPLREFARVTALAASWDAVLPRFERRLAAVVGRDAGERARRHPVLA